eukprot:GHVU01053452.1.p1 GENE.GHVU01053452.1~~GHVU01053452.1.p1  ORF type:complete len:150 (+),score=12.98 GHVU01053452.1:3-452(+)
MDTRTQTRMQINTDMEAHTHRYSRRQPDIRTYALGDASLMAYPRRRVRGRGRAGGCDCWRRLRDSQWGSDKKKRGGEEERHVGDSGEYDVQGWGGSPGSTGIRDAYVCTSTRPRHAAAPVGGFAHQLTQHSSFIHYLFHKRPPTAHTIS